MFHPGIGGEGDVDVTKTTSIPRNRGGARVDAASLPPPRSLISEASRRLRSGLGATSPKPTVVIVVMTRQRPAGTPVEPLAGPVT